MKPKVCTNSFLPLMREVARVKRVTEGEKKLTQTLSLSQSWRCAAAKPAPSSKGAGRKTESLHKLCPPSDEGGVKRRMRRLTEGEKINTDFVSPPVLAAARRQASPLVRGGKEKDRKPAQTLSSL